MKKNSQTRERVIEEAAKQFYLQGYKETTMRSLATAVGIKHPSLFSLFENKGAIAGEILAEYYTGLEKSSTAFIEEFLGKTAGKGEWLLTFYALNFALIYEDKRFAEFYTSFYEEDSEKVDEITRSLEHLSITETEEDEEKEITARLDVKMLGMTSMMLVKELALKTIELEFAVKYFVQKIIGTNVVASIFSEEEAGAFYQENWDKIQKESRKIDIYRDFLIPKE